MANEIPQDLLDEMIRMDNERFDEFEKAWRNNEQQKKEYEKQYYNQLSGYLLYNRIFNEDVRPLKPHEYALSLDKELLAKARAHNLDQIARAKEQEIKKDQPEKLTKPQPPTLEGLRKEYSEVKNSITERLMAKLPSTKLLECTPDTPSIGKERVREIEREIELS